MMSQEANPVRILIATPLKGDVPKKYFLASLQMSVIKQNLIVERAGEKRPVQLDWLLLDGPAVQVARNDCVGYAREMKFHELVFWDKDIRAEDASGNDITAAALVRLMEHDLDFVCAPYAAHDLETHWHVQTIDGKEADPETGLQEVLQCSIGFSKIKLSVFEKIEKANPFRVGVQHDPNRHGKKVTEFFPMGLDGHGTYEWRFKQIAGMVEKFRKGDANLGRAIGTIDAIEREIGLKYDNLPEFKGEDYFFCKLAKEVGTTIWMDSHLIMGHTSHDITLPIQTEKLITMLAEPWRQEDIIRAKQKIMEAAQKPMPPITTQ